VSEKPTSETDEATALLRKEHARFARRIGQLEATLQQVEQIRDTNARLLKRIMADLEIERARSHDLLLNVLPQAIIDRLNAGEGLIADRYDDVAVVFSDFVGFTEISGRLPVAILVASLNALYSAFDGASAALGVEKIKTIGDAYMAVAGVPETRPDHVEVIADLALDLRDAVISLAAQLRIPLTCRIGIANGPVVAGVIGRSRFAYDLWGHTVNIAARMEKHSAPGRILVTTSVQDRLRGSHVLEAADPLEVKGVGAVRGWYLEGRREPVAEPTTQFKRREAKAARERPRQQHRSLPPTPSPTAQSPEASPQLVVRRPRPATSFRSTGPDAIAPR
jgi:adenylate cyclase